MPLAPLFLTLASAALYAASFPPLALFPLAWFALVPFFVACVLVAPGRAALFGMLWGLAATYGVAWWLPGMVSDYLQVSTLAGWGGFFFVAIGLTGVYVASFAAWLSWLVRAAPASPIVVAAGWSACEFARATLWIGNSWALVGYSQTSFTRVIQVSDVAGPYGVGLLIAAVNACVAGFFHSRLRGQRPILSQFVVALSFTAVLLYGGFRLSQTFTVGEPIAIAIVQGAIDRGIRWSPQHTRENLDRYLTLSTQAAAIHPQIIFWPEYAVNFYLQSPSPLTEAVLRLSRDLKADVILGGPHYSYGLTNILQHNSIFLVREGRLTGRYDKVHLAPIAEENSLARFLPEFPNNYEPGNHVHALRTRAARVGVFVCIEALELELARRLVEAGAEVLANPSNDDWFGNAAAARQHLDIASVRAIEQRRYIIRATATGYSAVIDPYGRLTALSAFGVPETLTASVRRSQELTPYYRWGDVVSYGAIGFAFLTSLTRVGVAIRHRRTAL